MTGSGTATAPAAGGAARALTWLRARDPSLAAVRRAGRVTVAAYVGFATCRYLVDDPTTALYALFAVVALGALAEVTGPPADRTRTYLGSLVIAGLLVTLGTLLAVHTWTAVLGMLVVGFLVAYAGVGGPRMAGVVNGLQLFYVLPCFPPYAPDTLDQRLLGVGLGITLLAVADRVLWPAPEPADPGVRVADAAGRVAAYARVLAREQRDGGDGGSSALRAAAADAAASLRLSTVPIAERPLGPGVRDRSLIRAAAAIRVISDRLGVLADVWPASGGSRTHPATARLMDAVADVLTEGREALLGTGPPPSTDRLDLALGSHREWRRQEFLDRATEPAALRAGVTTVAVAEAARSLVLTVRGAVGAPAPDPAHVPEDLWFLTASTGRLWWRRLRAHLTPRSVYLQNAVRLALGLAVARTVAGVLELSHGFWVLLATLSLMRTCAVAGRSVLVRAVAGTAGGAVVAGGVLFLVGADAPVYAWVLPGLMVVAFAAGSLFGVAAGQAGFTVVVALLFAQVAPVNWRLAEVRLEDVLVGGLVGILIGAAVWPRGGRGELLRAAGKSLRAGAEEIVAVVGQLTGAGSAHQTSLGRRAALLDHTYAQYRSEPTRPGSRVDWLAVLGVVHRVDDYSRTLRSRYPAAAPPPWPRLAAQLRTAAADVAAGYREAAAAVAADRVPTARPAVRVDRVPRDELAAAPDDALRMLDTWGWLLTLADDLAGIGRALDPPPPAGGLPPRARHRPPAGRRAGRPPAAGSPS
ncbi:FUSC family protein [Geodermatophilus sp. URMC 61]|uniref:FUSC family protein n=1 Tax=Geodermatophilus sp. URMC 61 TaxID=3423411 RepID=UPI00406D33FB